MKRKYLTYIDKITILYCFKNNIEYFRIFYYYFRILYYYLGYYIIEDYEDIYIYTLTHTYIY